MIGISLSSKNQIGLHRSGKRRQLWFSMDFDLLSKEKPPREAKDGSRADHLVVELVRFE
jgi:hypothetical protein